MSDAARFWDARYAEEGFAYGEGPSELVVAVEPSLPRGARVLCLAEGEGRNAVFLAEKGHDVLAIDLSAVGLDKARALAASRGVALRTLVADLNEHPFAPSAYDAVFAIWMHLPPPVLERVLAGVSLTLVPGGRLVMESYRKEQLALGTGGPREPALLVDPAELRASVEGHGFVVERLESLDRVVHEGRYHEGPSAVVQLVARKPS